jgi:hypothetical protein
LKKGWFTTISLECGKEFIVFRKLSDDSGKNHKRAIITLNDRASGMLWMRTMETLEALVVRSKICEMLDEI